MTDWSKLRDEAKSEGFYRGPGCSVGMFLASLTAKERAQVESVIADQQLQGSAIARALHNRVGDDAPNAHSINRHRSDRCVCAQKAAKA